MGSFLRFTFLKTRTFDVGKFVFTEMEEAKMKYVIWSEAAYIKINSFYLETLFNSLLQDNQF